MPAGFAARYTVLLSKLCSKPPPEILCRSRQGIFRNMISNWKPEWPSNACKIIRRCILFTNVHFSTNFNKFWRICQLIPSHITFPNETVMSQKIHGIIAKPSSVKRTEPIEFHMLPRFGKLDRHSKRSKVDTGSSTVIWRYPSSLQSRGNLKSKPDE